jgi:hypothetical protein
MEMMKQTSMCTTLTGPLGVSALTTKPILMYLLPLINISRQ